MNTIEKMISLFKNEEKNARYIKDEINKLEREEDSLDNRTKLTKAEFDFKESLEMMENIKKYLKRLSFIKKVREYENSSR